MTAKHHLLILCLFIAISSFAQIAQYPLTTDADDTIGNLNGTPSPQGVTFVDNDHTSITGEGLITFPHELNANTLDDNKLFLSFEFRLDENEQYALLFSGSYNNRQAPWENQGFRLHIDRTELILNYANGDDSGIYVWTGTHNLEPNRWYQLSFVIDLEAETFATILDGVIDVKPFENFLDREGFVKAIENSSFTIGGVNGTKLNGYKGGFDIRNLAIYDAPPSQSIQINHLYNDLRRVLEGTLTLSDEMIRKELTIAEGNLPFVDYPEVADTILAFCRAYEDLNPPLYQDGRVYGKEDLPLLDRALQSAQQYILEYAFTPEFLDKVEGLIFEHHLVAPGPVKANTARISAAEVELNGTYHAEAAAELTDQSRVVRPTGYYAAPGEIITLQVPENVVNKGLSIIVGSHFRNMDYDYIGDINRFPDISTEFAVSSSEIRVANPLGGGIYLKVPEGTDVGWFTMQIRDAIKSPYFSYRAGRQTNVAEWQQQVAETGSPWADFESDKFMFTIQTSLLEGIRNPDQIMARWDEIMDAIRFVAGRSFVRPRAEYYMSDTRLVTPAYGAGYPMVIPNNELQYSPGWNPLTVLERPPHQILFHEMGHNHLHPTLDFGPDYNSCGFIEAETIVHMLAVSVHHRVYGMSIEDAFAWSQVDNGFTFEEACMDWIMTSNFRQDLPMIYDESAPLEDKEMLKYQPRGWAKYGDIARLYGLGGLSSVNGQFYHEGGIQTGTVCPPRPFIVGRDEYIMAACEALGENVTPLFYFWGIQPTGPVDEQMMAYSKSQKVKALIERYRCEVAPHSKEDYEVYYNRMYPLAEYQHPRLQQYLDNFNDSYVQEIQAQFDHVLTKYGLVGPATPTQLEGTVNENTVSLSWKDESDDESGFLIRLRKLPDGAWTEIAQVPANASTYELVIPEIGSYELQISSLNLDGLESNVCETPQIGFDISSITTGATQIENHSLQLYPNPTSDQAILYNPEGKALQQLQIVDVTGRLRLLQKLVPGQAQYSMPLDGLEAGVYIIKARDAVREYQLRVLKQ